MPPISGKKRNEEIPVFLDCVTGFHQRSLKPSDQQINKQVNAYGAPPRAETLCPFGTTYLKCPSSSPRGTSWKLILHCWVFRSIYDHKRLLYKARNLERGTYSDLNHLRNP